MADELHKDSIFSDVQVRDSYNTYLNSEADRLAINSRQCHLEKLERKRSATWLGYDRKGGTSNSVLEDLRSEHSPFPLTEPVDGSSNSLLESYKASVEQDKVSIKHMEKEISILKREKEDYSLMSEDNFRKSEQRLRDKEDDVVSTGNYAVILT